IYIDDLGKLGRFYRTLNKYLSYKPHHGETVDFRYAHVFTDWQNVRFFSFLHHEIERLSSLIYLEGLSHVRHVNSEIEKLETPDEEKATASNKRMNGGTHYQNLLAIYYLLQYAKANCHNTKKAKFASFITGFSNNTLRQQWSNIHWKKDEKGLDWESDMKIVRGYFEELGLPEVVKSIDNDLNL